MKVFVSWSGERSMSVAAALKTWLSDVFPHLEVWMSAHDIHAGDPWTNALHQRLRESQFGILCLTESNLAAPWLLYEAGALVMSVKPGRVVPYLVDLPPGQVKQPISQLQGVAADREGTYRLLQALNEASELSLPEERLKKTFEKWWADLEALLGLPLESRIDGSIAVVVARPLLFSDDEVRRLRDVLTSALDRGATSIVVDCAAIESLNSNFLSTLAFVMKRVRRNGGEIALARVQPVAMEVLRITHFDQLVACCETVEEAIQRLRESR